MKKKAIFSCDFSIKSQRYIIEACARPSHSTPQIAGAWDIEMPVRDFQMSKDGIVRCFACFFLVRKLDTSDLFVTIGALLVPSATTTFWTPKHLLCNSTGF